MSCTHHALLQVFDSDDPLGAPRVKGSRCITKYKWRSEAQANGGPVIVGARFGLNPPMVDLNLLQDNLWQCCAAAARVARVVFSRKRLLPHQSALKSVYMPRLSRGPQRFRRCVRIGPLR